MKILQLDNNYFRFPEGIKSVEEFVKFVNNSSQKFIKMTMLSEEHSVAPYFIEEDQKTVYVNPLQVTILKTKVHPKKEKSSFIPHLTVTKLFTTVTVMMLQTILIFRRRLSSPQKMKILCFSKDTPS